MNHRISRRGLLSGTGAAGAGLLGLAAGQTQRSRRPRGAGLDRRPLPQPGLHRVSLDASSRSRVPIDYTISYDQFSRDQLRNYDYSSVCATA